MTSSSLGRGIADVAVLGCLVACNADPGIEYVDCLPPKPPYIERFDGTEQTLADRCWATLNSADRDVKIGQDDDLIITHTEAVAWDGTSPTLLRHIEGDFVIATKTEASSGLNSNFCGMNEGDASGLVVQADSIRATFLVRPLLAPGVTCEDESENPPLALAFAQSTMTPTPAPTPTGIGIDGEADIAICRRNDRLAYFYRDPDDAEADWQPEDWKQLAAGDGTGKTDIVGQGPLGVGVTTTVSETGVPLGIEGHFNWVAVLDLSEDCLGPLQELESPENE